MKHFISSILLMTLVFSSSFAQDEDEVDLGQIYVQGKAKYQEQKYKEAISILEPIYADIKSANTDSSLFVYLTTILGDSYYFTSNNEKAQFYFKTVDTLCRNTTNPKITTLTLYALSKQIEIYDQVGDQLNTKKCIQKAFGFYPPNSVLNEQYANILLYTTSSYIKNNDSLSLNQLSKTEYPRFFSSTTVPACEKYLVLDYALSYAEKNNKFKEASTYLNAYTLPSEPCTEGILYHSYLVYSSLNEQSKVDKILEERFPNFYRSATKTNHGPYLILAVAQRRSNLYDIDSSMALLNHIENNNWVESLGPLYPKYVILKASNYSYYNQWSKSVELYEQALTKVTDPNIQLSFYSEFAKLYDEQGDFITADNYYLKIKNGASFDKQSSSFRGGFYSNLAYHNQLLGKWNEADQNYIQALTTLNKTADAELIDKTLNNQAVFFLSIGKNKEALETYNKLLIKYAPNKNDAYIAILENKASTLSILNEYAQALVVYDEVYALLKNKPNSEKNISEVLFNKTYLLIKEKKYAEAETQYQLLLNTNTNSSEIFKSKLYSNLAEAQEHNKKYPDALTNYTKSYDLRVSMLGKNHPEIAAISSKLARVSWVQKDYTKADFHWFNSLQNYNKQIIYLFPSLTETERVEFYNTFKNQIEQFNSYAEQRYKDNKAILDTLFSYQSILQGLMFSSETKVQKQVTQSKSPEVTQLYEKLIANREAISERYNGKNKLNADSLQKANFKIEKELLLKLDLKINQDKISVQELASHLNDDELFIQFIRFRKYKPELGGTYVQYSINNTTIDSVYYFALCISKASNSIQPIVIKNGSFLESRQIKYYLNCIKFKNKDSLSYSHFWKEIDVIASNYKTIYAVLDGVYNLINPASLTDTKDNLLMDRYTFTRLSTSSEITQRRNTIPKINNVLLLGNPTFKPIKYQNQNFELAQLPETEIELTDINSKLKNKSVSGKMVTSTQATEENFRSNAVQNQVLHIATHGFFLNVVDHNMEEKNLANPLFNSGIFLVPSTSAQVASTNDGIISSYEVASMDLGNVELVVLSACESGLGELRNGEGVYGLQRALRTAGARTIIMSLWKVDDAATAYFMKAFYDDYLINYNAGKALAYAQQETRKVYKEPKYWAAFCLIGI